MRGQNNVQGVSDMGVLATFLPGYARISDQAEKKRFEHAWGSTVPADPGLTIVEMINAAGTGEIKALYFMGENPAMSDPDAGHVREALCRVDHIVVQDIFLTETAALADVVLPTTSMFEKWGTFTNTNRQIQLSRPVLSAPGDARQDLWVLQEMARRLGPGYTKILIVTLPEATPVLEASSLQDDLRRAQIEPFAWVVNGSLAAAQPRDPVLQARAAAEIGQIRRVKELARRVALVRFQAEEPVGVERLAALSMGADRPI